MLRQGGSEEFRLEVPTLKIIDFVDDLRPVDVPGTHDELAADMVKFKDFLDRPGVRYFTREGKHWWPARVTPLLGLMVDTNEGVVRIEQKEVTWGCVTGPGNIRTSA